MTLLTWNSKSRETTLYYEKAGQQLWGGEYPDGSGRKDF